MMNNLLKDFSQQIFRDIHGFGILRTVVEAGFRQILPRTLKIVGLKGKKSMAL